MLPDIRAVIAAMVAVIGLLLISFAVVTAYRAAQQHQAGSLQADLAKRGQTVPPPSGDRPVLIVETPGPQLAPAVEPVENPPVEAATAVAEPEPPVAPQAPPAQPAIGGPLVAAPESTRNVAAENPTRIDTRAWQQAAAEKARKARAARIAREKAAARRAAQARRTRQKETPAFESNSFGGSFGGTFTAPTGR